MDKLEVVRIAMQRYNQITEEALKKIIEEDLQIIESWIGWSADKRTNKGWFFLLNDEGNPVVRYYPTEDLETSDYSSLPEACAKFIKEEMEEVRRSIY